MKMWFKLISSSNIKITRKIKSRKYVRSQFYMNIITNERMEHIVLYDQGIQTDHQTNDKILNKLKRDFP